MFHYFKPLLSHDYYKKMIISSIEWLVLQKRIKIRNFRCMKNVVNFSV